jgi:hypothetical protein
MLKGYLSGSMDSHDVEAACYSYLTHASILL